MTNLLSHTLPALYPQPQEAWGLTAVTVISMPRFWIGFIIGFFLTFIVLTTLRHDRLGPTG